MNPCCPPFLRPLLSLGLTATLAGIAPGQSEELAKLVPIAAVSHDRAGTSVDIEGDIVVVGAPHADPMGSSSGAATIYRLDGGQWTEQQTINPADGAAGDLFGWSVGVSDGAVLVGAPEHDALGANAGAVYVYRETNGVWALEKKLQAGDGNANDQFGFSLSVDGSLAVVGARHREEGAQSNAGAAYCFEYKNPFLGWSEVQKLIAANASSQETFGWSVSLQSNYLVVGCPSRIDANLRPGSVFVYEWDGSNWSLMDELFAETIAHLENFGFAVAISYPQVVVGAPFNDDVTTNAGAVSFLQHDGSSWTETRVPNPRTESFAYYGGAVACDGEAALVAAPESNLVGADSGAVDSYHLHLGEWVADQVYGSSALGAGDLLGSSVAVDGHRAAIGAPRDHQLGTDDGAAFVHSVDELLLRASNPTPSAGDPLAFSALNGTPGTRCFFTVDSIGGGPFFQILFFSNFASNHEFAFSTAVPPGLGGTSITFRCYRKSAWGKTLGSNFETVDFQ